MSDDRKTRSVCNCHDLGAFPVFRIADSTTPFFAGLKLPSMNVSRMSIPPRSFRSSASSLTMRWETPCRTHCWNCRWHVWYGGYRCANQLKSLLNPVLSTEQHFWINYTWRFCLFQSILRKYFQKWFLAFHFLKTIKLSFE